MGALVLGIVCIALFLPTALTTEIGITNDPDSDVATNLIDSRLPEETTTTEIVVIRSESLTVDDDEFRSEVERLAGAIGDAEGVASVTTFYESGEESLVSENRRAMLMPVAFEGNEEDAETNVVPVVDLVEAAGDGGAVDVTITGEASSGVDQQELSQHDLKTGELMFGLPAALVVLALVFGALVAAAVPLILSIFAIVLALAMTALIGQISQVSFFVINMITAMGLALGIDYSLFVLSRFREERARGLAKVDAIAAAGATASRAVLFSGVAFVIALLGMLLVPLNVLKSLAAGAILAGIVAVAAALTLLPALLSVLGDRVNSLRVPVIGRVAEAGASEGRFWSAIVRVVMRHAVFSLTVVVVLLVALSIPVTQFAVGSGGITAIPDSYPSKQGFLALNEEFPTATSEPLEIVIDGDVGSSEVESAIAALEADIGSKPIFGEPQLRVEEESELAVLTVPVSGDPQASAATEAARDLREDSIPAAFGNTEAQVYVGGGPGMALDYFDTTSTWLPRVFVFVLLISFILLTIAFRSLVVPLKAIILNLLSVGAAYGLLVLVFQKGYGTDLLGFSKVESIEAWVPLFLFSVLFGLSMDYHVFLLSRIRERYLQTGDNAESVAYGVSSTARLITGAALIIIAVFTGFALGDFTMFQQMGFGVGVALFLDATVIRSILVPASMKLLGDRNWYLPKWLEWIPDFGVEGKPRTEGAPRR